jgi:hypothetical protein
LYLYNILQAYIQLITLFNCNFYINPPYKLTRELNLNNDSVLKVIKPLYGIPEAGNYWFKTYYSYYINELSIEQSTYNPCLLYSKQPFGIVGLQTDNTLFVGTNDFVKTEQLKLQEAKFLTKECKCLTINYDLKFNRGIIYTDTTRITLI